MKNILLIVAAMFAVTSSACVIDGLDGAEPSHRFYATVAQYDQAKVHAVEFVRSPAVTLETAERILKVVQKADAEIAVFMDEIDANGFPEDGFAAAEAAVRLSLTRLMLEIELPAGGVI